MVLFGLGFGFVICFGLLHKKAPHVGVVRGICLGFEYWVYLSRCLKSVGFMQWKRPGLA